MRHCNTALMCGGQRRPLLMLLMSLAFRPISHHTFDMPYACSPTSGSTTKNHGAHVCSWQGGGCAWKIQEQFGVLTCLFSSLPLTLMCSHCVCVVTGAS
ncbi:hypothetical protein GDO78_021753 [Eleutherodactylus coqui]|uniref:Secreted protein n=1 Tax=Eleutherodactylus coqui TaxID=57060 RepID=A0A8J6EH19_ELECQ|nr:hypothetical protein GDO78_021753 [Eleutherodactylus coqui]